MVDQNEVQPLVAVVCSDEGDPQEGTSAVACVLETNSTSSSNYIDGNIILENLENYDISIILKANVFEFLCHYPKKGSEITICLNKGCDLYKKCDDDDDYPIHCAAKTGCADNLQAILKKEPKLVNQLDSNECTALHIVIQSINADNYKTSFEAITTLIEFKADINYVIRSHSSIDDKIWQEMLEFIDEHVFFIDFNLLKQDDVQNILQFCCPTLWEKWVVDDYSELNTTTIVSRLEQLFEDEKQFIRNLYTISIDTEFVEVIQEIIKEGNLLKIAIKNVHYKRNLSMIAIRKIFEIGKKIITEETFYKVVDNVLCYSSDFILKELLDIWTEFDYGIYKKPLLHGDMWISSFDKLLDHEAIDLNILDENGDSALCRQIFQSNKTKIEKLLRKHVFIGSLDAKRKIQAMDNIDPEMFKEYLDDCIFSPETEIYILTPFCLKDYKYIEYNYKCLKPPSEYQTTANELTAINRIASNKKLQHLIHHPLIMSYLLLKWNLMCPIFYIYLFLYIIIFILLFIHITFDYGQKDTSNGFAWMSWIFFLTTVICEVVKFVLLPFQRYFNKSKLIEWALIVFTLLTSIDYFDSNSNRRSIGALANLFAAIELMLLLGTIPTLSLSLYISMLKKVTITYMKVFAVFSVLLILGFANSFYILFRTDDEQEKVNSTNSTEDSLQITNLAFAVLKTFVMTTGELNASSLKFKLSVWAGYFIFVVFVFCVVIIIMNLVIGLAVSDTQQIISDARLYDWIERVKLMEKIEQILITHKSLYDLIPDELKLHTNKIPIDNKAKQIYPKDAQEMKPYEKDDDFEKPNKANLNSTNITMPSETESEHRFLCFTNCFNSFVSFINGHLKRYLKQRTVEFSKIFFISHSNIVSESLEIIKKGENKKKDPSIHYKDKLNDISSLLEKLENQSNERFKQRETVIEENCIKMLQKVEECKNKQQENYEEKLKVGFKLQEKIIEEKCIKIIQKIEFCKNKEHEYFVSKLKDQIKRQEENQNKMLDLLSSIVKNMDAKRNESALPRNNSVPASLCFFDNEK